MSILSFTDAHDKRHGPDPEHIWNGPDGERWLRYLCEFEHDGEQYSFEIWAKDNEDAERRVASLRASSVLMGQVYETGLLP